MVRTITTNDLMSMLAMEEIAVLDDRSRTYRAPDQPEPADRVFGGLQLAQAVMAAATNAPAHLRPLALSADFLAAVPTTGSNTWLVEEIGTAKAMSSRRATLLGDDGEALFTATVRLGAVREDLPSYATVRARDVTPPEELPTLVERFGADDRIPPWWSMRRPVDFRHVETPAYTESVEPPQAHQSVWWRPDGEIPGDPLPRPPRCSPTPPT